MEKDKKGSKWFNRLIRIVLLVVVILSIVGVRHTLDRNLYGNRKIERFPFKLLKNLPDEPNWREKNVIDQRWEWLRQSEELVEWICSLDENIGIINKSGDPMLLRNSVPRYGTPFGVTLFNNNGNLVIVYDDIQSYSLKRIEIFSMTTVQYGKRYIAVEQTLFDEMNSYIDYEDNNTLYYYVNDGMAKIVPMDEGVEEISGAYLYKGNTKFPILQKDGKIFTYVLEDSEGGLYSYEYRTDAIRIKKVILSELNRICEIKKLDPDRTDSSLELVIHLDDGSYVWIYLSEYVLLQEGEYNLEDIMPILTQRNSFIIENVGRKNYIYFDKSKGYDSDNFY